MEKERPLGIRVINKVPWGTHLCQFYQTKADLIDILVPYFKAGLENNEFCVWITAELLTAEEANQALQKEVKNLNDYINKGQIEVLDYSKWYVKSGKFESIKVLQGWTEKENQVLKKGFDGVRITGNTFWLDQKDWRDFVDYEAAVDSVIGKHRMIAICSYSLNKCGASEILDVVSNHQYCLIKQNGKWRLTQSAGRVRAEEELIEKNHDLGERIKELNCLYSISNLGETEGVQLEQILQGTVDLIPNAFQHPEIICARITLKDKKFRTENFKETQWKLTQDLVHGDRIGSLEIYCLEERPENKEVFFLKEEKDLFKAIAERLGGIIEHKWAERELKKYRLHLEELVKERTAQLVTANEQLKHEVTERKRTETKYRNLMENASDAIFITDKEGNFLEVNKKTEILLGYNRKELINMNIAQIHPKEDLERILRSFKEIQRKGEGVLTNGFILRKDGKTVPVDITGDVIKLDNKEVIQAIFRDITERKRIEGEFQKIDKLEAIGVLAGGIAHDFNNFLTGIIGNLSMAELYTKPGDNIFETLQRAKKASKRAGQLTKQLLTFSKGGAPIKQTASIPELIEDTASFALRGSKVRCKYSLPDNLWSVEIDKGQISQIINNLIINANHAMPDGGIITISAENIIINGNNSLPLEEGKYVKVSVKDQGIGISKEHLGKIFDPYFTTKENGSGLGLASCYSIAKNHEGFITVESEIGAGTTFYIYLPVSDKEIFEVKEIVEEELYLGKGTILFMDDEEEVIDTAQQMILQLGYEIKIAKNGAEAIKMYKKAKETGEAFDVVILDLTIPGDMGGKETIKRLLKIDPNLKAIVSSGYSNNPIMAEYKIYGFKGVVAKPYEIQGLSEILYKVINGKEVTVPT